MRSLVIFILSLIVGLWVVAIAVLSIQNVFVVDSTGESSLVALRFLGQASIQMPLGVILAISAAIGMIGTGLILLPLSRKR